MRTRTTKQETATPKAKGKLSDKKLQVTVRDLDPKKDVSGGAVTTVKKTGPCSCVSG